LPALSPIPLIVLSTCRAANACEGVGQGKAKVVVTMDADGCARNVRNVFANAANQFAILLGNGVARGVGNVDDRCACINDGLQHLEKVGRNGAAGIFRVELNVVNAVARALYGKIRPLTYLVSDGMEEIDIFHRRQSLELEIAESLQMQSLGHHGVESAV
jgi:hypothetical protein